MVTLTPAAQHLFASPSSIDSLLSQEISSLPSQNSYDVHHLPPGYEVAAHQQHFYPDDARVGVAHWYVIGDIDILGIMNRYSKRGLAQDRFTGEPLEAIRTHELFHATSEMGGNEGHTRWKTRTEDPSMLFLHPELYCKN